MLPNGRAKVDAIAERRVDIASSDPPRVAVQATREMLNRIDGLPTV